MATNLVPVNVYQINQGPPIPLVNVSPIAFPTQGCLVTDCTNSPTRALSTGVSVYSAIVTPSGDKFYSERTQASIITAFNA